MGLHIPNRVRFWHVSKALRLGRDAELQLQGTSGKYDTKLTIADLVELKDTADELVFLDGVVAGTGAAEKAVVLDANGGAAIPGELELDGNTFAVEAGVGITDGVGTIYRSGVLKAGGIIHSKILLDLTGLAVSATDLDIIGVDDTGVAHLGQITAARNGTILGGTMTCLEVPVGGADDIDLYAADEGTGVEDVDVTTLTQTALITSGGAWTLGQSVALGAVPVADQFLYLTAGEGTAGGTYTAGKFLIELEGYDA